MKIIHILVISCLFSFISIPSKAQSPVQNIEQEDRIIIKNFVDSLLLTHAIDSVAAKKAYTFINNRMNEGYYDNYTDNNINYLLQITHDIQKILDDNYFEAFFASPAEKGKTQLNKNADVVRHWWNKTGYDDITYDSLHKAGKIFKIPFRPFTRGYDNKGWFSKVLFYEHIDEMLTYKTGYNGMGVPELKILEGNIGYVKIKHWIDNTQLNIPIWAVVAHYLYNTEAIIVDVRDSGKGDITAMINFLRYFLPPSKDYLGSTYHKPTHTKQDFFNTKKHVLKPHKVKKKHKRNTERYINRPLVDFSELKGNNIRLLNQNIYILTDKKTISISEYFALLLRKYRRATLIGENTAGYGYITHHHQLWSGGLQVHIPETKIIAMDSIHRKGLSVDWKTDEPLETTWTKLVQQFADSTEFVYTQNYLDGLLAYKKAQKDKIQLTDLQLQNIVGNYTFAKKIVAEKGVLYLDEFGERKKLTAVDSNLFIVDSFYDNTKEINLFSYVSHYANTKLEPVYVRFDTNDLGKSALFLIYFGGLLGEFQKEEK